jgi:endonuclease/exonuclease/phosphatase family metal-dependent hydrolase
MTIIRQIIIHVLLVSSLAAFYLESVENSIVPAIEKFEQLKNLPVEKYSKNQYLEIASALQRINERIRLISYNVLFDFFDRNLDKVNRWPQRLPRIVDLLEEMQPDIICVQELYTNQIQDLMPYLENTFLFYSGACEDGELIGIFYQKDRFEVVSSKIWYMTSTPDVPSSETLTMLKLKDLKTGRHVAVFNTHLAFSNINKRDFQARFIAEHVELYAQQMPTILAGDINTFPNRLDLAKLPFYDGDYVHRILTQGALKDAINTSILGHLGPISTFSNHSNDVVPFRGTGTPGVFLDHIYVSKDIHVLMHAVQSGTVGGHFPSDHLPVIVDLIVE